MACKAICRWTICSLVGAFLDLMLSYLLLCGAVAALIAEKFLALFGLTLPCPCDGLFGQPRNSASGSNCLQGLLVDCPSAKISAVSAVAWRRFPFGTICSDEGIRSYDVRFVGEGGDGDRRRLRGVKHLGSCESSFGFTSSKVVGALPGASGEFGLLEKSSSKRKASVLGIKARSAALRRRRARNKAIFSEGKASVPPLASEEPVLIPNQKANFVEGAEEGVVELEPTICFNKDGKHSRTKCGEEVDYVTRLEIELEEGRAAYAALCLDLEKERSAAASAADEAMAMISRLHDEKAAIEMEARQYQRMIEEKSAYDEEKMNILMEIIVRRERENHVLEKELEECRTVLFGGSAVSSLMKDVHASYRNFEVFTEKELMNEDELQRFSNGVKDNQGSIMFDPSSTFEAVNGATSPEYIFDVHVVDDKPDSGEKCSGKEDEHLHFGGSSIDPTAETAGFSSIYHSFDCSTSRYGGMQDGIFRSPSRPASMFTDSWSEGGSEVDLRRSSMSAVDDERVKLETEVDSLRRRLKMVQQGREKLSFSVEHREKEAFQLQLLDEIASHLREIRKIADPGKGIRRPSLPPPPPSSEVDSRKRRCKSANWGL